MKATELITKLRALVDEHGDLPVVCHEISSNFDILDYEGGPTVEGAYRHADGSHEAHEHSSRYRGAARLKSTGVAVKVVNVI